MLEKIMVGLLQCLTAIPIEFWYIFASACSAFFMSMLMAFRANRINRQTFAQKFAEACTCAMLSSGFTLILISTYGIDLNLSIPIGTAFGYLGTDTIKMFFKHYLIEKVPFVAKAYESKKRKPNISNASTDTNKVNKDNE